MKLVNSEAVEKIVRSYLKGKGFSLSKQKKQGQTGADIVAMKGKQTRFIEVIGFQSAPPTRSREFYEAFFRAISRDQNRAQDTLIIALPIRFRNGMRRRKQQYPVAWGKLGEAFPNLKLWYVDVDHNSVEEYPWLTPFD
jgi:Holliday junction resolvase-like predicted endonuclease